jgi:hypothetical protein
MFGGRGNAKTARLELNTWNREVMNKLGNAENTARRGTTPGSNRAAWHDREPGSRAEAARMGLANQRRRRNTNGLELREKPACSVIGYDQ